MHGKINSFFIEKKMLTGTVIDVFYNSFSFIIEEILKLNELLLYFKRSMHLQLQKKKSITHKNRLGIFYSKLNYYSKILIINHNCIDTLYSQHIYCALVISHSIKKYIYMQATSHQCLTRSVLRGQAIDDQRFLNMIRFAVNLWTDSNLFIVRFSM